MNKLFPSPVSARTAQRKLAQELMCLYAPEEAKALAWQAVELAMQATRVRLLMHSEVPLTTTQVRELENMAARLLQHEPIQYISGTTEFCGLELQVGPGVLIPRPETEELALHIINKHKSQAGLRVLDIGTGSGCLALALAASLPEAQVHAIDRSEAALTIARENASRLQLPVQFHQADVLQPLPDTVPEQFGLIVSNPPYVLPSEEEHMLPNVLLHEPHEALFVPENDPLLFYRHIAAHARARLKSGSWLYFETNERYAKAVAGLLKNQGFKKAAMLTDMFGKPRFAEAQQP